MRLEGERLEHRVEHGVNILCDSHFSSVHDY